MSDFETSYSRDNAKLYKKDDDPQLTFVRILNDNRLSMTKSQLPGIRAKKIQAINNIIEKLHTQTGQWFDEKQVLKKINNMKSRIKIKANANQKGCKKIKLAKWEQMFLNILREETSQE